MESLSIGELAARACVPTTTVRYYERKGLLRRPQRTASNYRAYDQEAVERLRFIRASQAAGLTLSDIKALLGYRDGTVSPCREVRVLLEKRLENVEASLTELRHLRKALRSFVDVCRQAEGDEPCGVVERLDRAGHDA